MSEILSGCLSLVREISVLSALLPLLLKGSESDSSPFPRCPAQGLSGRQGRLGRLPGAGGDGTGP